METTTIAAASVPVVITDQAPVDIPIQHRVAATTMAQAMELSGQVHELALNEHNNFSIKDGSGQAPELFFAELLLLEYLRSVSKRTEQFLNTIH